MEGQLHETGLFMDYMRGLDDSWRGYMRQLHETGLDDSWRGSYMRQD